MASASVAPRWDPFGMSAEGVARGLRLLRPLYKSYFRVRSHGRAGLPESGPVIFAANHSGMLPIDAMMLWYDLAQDCPLEATPRPLADYFVPRLPVIGTLFSRGGAVAGVARNAERALRSGGRLLLFPEGVAGISKGFRRRYQLQRWTVGHVELARRFGAPVVPVSIVGAEEAWAQLLRLPSPIRRIPHLPLPLTPLPLPVQIWIDYGAPIHFSKSRSSEGQCPAQLEEDAARVRDAVAGLIAQRRKSRRDVPRAAA